MFQPNQVRWYKESRGNKDEISQSFVKTTNVQNDSPYQLKLKSELRIPDVSEKDFGNYFCAVKNDKGEQFNQVTTDTNTGCCILNYEVNECTFLLTSTVLTSTSNENSYFFTISEKIRNAKSIKENENWFFLSTIYWTIWGELLELLLGTI